jgi:poly(3-hydroxybutyrate) depolymerase
MIRASKLIVAAALAASLPAAAAARDCDHGVPAPEAWGQPTAYYPVRPAPAPYRWREARWRERELFSLRAEFRALDDERARFYAQPGVRRGQARRFERYYAERRADLERRWNDLQYVAMR